MRIAQIAPCWLTIPPRGYGGVESVVALLTDGLVERGHDVTLFAAGGSATKARLVTHFDQPLGTIAQVEDPILELPHVLRAYDRAEEFDVVHDHTFPLGPSLGAQRSHPPVVHTLHRPAHLPRPARIYDVVGKRLGLVAVSNAQRMARPDLRYVATVHNGIAVADYPVRAAKQDYLLFVGRMSPRKGVHLAVQAARRAGRRLLLACKLQEPAERRYFEAAVEPLLDDSVEFLGEVGYADKLELYANAVCTLVPLQWPEPFGLVMVESLAAGTPVVAFRRGSAPEIIEHGVTGFLADDLDDLVTCIGRAASLDPRACRRAAESRFGAERMVDGYEAVYATVAG